MEFEGKWIVNKVITFGEDGEKWMTASEIANLENNEENLDYLNLLRMVVVIDGETAKSYAKGTEEELAEIEAELGIKAENGMILIEERPVSLIDGKYQVLIGEEDDQPLYYPLAVNEEGLLPFSDMMVLQRA